MLFYPYVILKIVHSILCGLRSESIGIELNYCAVILRFDPFQNECVVIFKADCVFVDDYKFGILGLVINWSFGFVSSLFDVIVNVFKIVFHCIVLSLVWFD